MTLGNIKITASDLIPAAFMGSPIGLMLPGVLMHFMPLGWALLVGANVGLVAGLALIAAIRSA